MMDICIGDTVLFQDQEYTTIARLNSTVWLCYDAEDSSVFISTVEMSKAPPTHELDGILLEHGVVFADHVISDKLQRYRIQPNMLREMNRHWMGHWTTSDGVKWRWDLSKLSFWRNGVFFAVRLMTPCGRWI